MSLMIDQGRTKSMPHVKWSEQNGEAEEGLFEFVRSELDGRSGAVLISGMPTDTNAALIKFAGRFGSTNAPGELADHKLEDGCVYRVEVKGSGLKNPAGGIVKSTSSEDFPSHTDGFGSHHPPRYVFLLCVTSETDGGASFLVPVEDIVNDLKADAVDILRQPLFATASGFFPVLFPLPDATWGARFNFDDMMVATEKFPMAAEAVEAAEAMAATCVRLAATNLFHLHPGDCLVVENRRVLHGRTGFVAQSPRLLKRIRVYG